MERFLVLLLVILVSGCATLAEEGLEKDWEDPLETEEMDVFLSAESDALTVERIVRLDNDQVDIGVRNVADQKVDVSIYDFYIERYEGEEVLIEDCFNEPMNLSSSDSYECNLDGEFPNPDETWEYRIDYMNRTVDSYECSPSDMNSVTC